MGIETALFSYVTGDVAVGGLIGARMYPVILPQDPTYPAVRYAVVSAPREHDHDGPNGLVRARVQVDVYGVTYASVKAVKEAIRGRLDGFRGNMAGVTVGSAHLLSERDGFEDSAGVFDVSFDFSIWFHE
jgi:hypothetical protein